MKRLLAAAITLSLLVTQPALAVTKKTIPLTYHPTVGDYTFPVYMGKNHKKAFNLMLDTGSSNLNLIGDKELCPKCEAITAYETYKPGSAIKATDKTFKMQYGKGGGQLRQYQGQVRLEDDLHVKGYTFGIYLEGKNISNIAGMAFTKISAPVDAPLTPFFNQLNKKYDFNNQFSVQLCDNRGPSILFLGPLDKTLAKKDNVQLPVLDRGFYFVNHTFITDKHNKPILTVPKNERAILDTATSGKIIYPDSALKPLISYLKAHTSKKNRALPDEFWNGTACGPKSMIDKKAFPTLYFNFRDKQNKLIRLALSPERYITSSSCGKGSLKLAFTGFKSHLLDPKTKHHKKAMPFPIILGTPFLEGFLVTFDKSKAPYVRLYPSDELCKRREK